ncbi:hypothetical protein DMENIID0001_069790 [Sergentomyia squamirostris]
MNFFTEKVTSNPEEDIFGRPQRGKKPYSRGNRGKQSFNRRQDNYRRRVGVEVMKKAREEGPSKYAQYLLNLFYSRIATDIVSGSMPIRSFFAKVHQQKYPMFH